jgi:hypothetical protein
MSEQRYKPSFENTVYNDSVSDCCHAHVNQIPDIGGINFGFDKICSECKKECHVLNPVEPAPQPEPQGDRITLKQSCGHRFRCADCGFCVQASNDEVGANRQLDKIVAPLKEKIAEQVAEIKRLEGMMVNLPTPEEANVLLHNLNCTDFCGEKDLRSICLDCAILLNGAAKLKAQSAYKEEAGK